MKAKDIVDKYIEHIGRHLVGQEDIGAIMPFILLDIQYDIYCKKIKPLVVRQELKMIRKRWSENYNAYNQGFFRIFNEDEVEYICDLMDRLKEHINTDLVKVKVALHNRLMFEDFEKREVHSAALMCNILAQMAGIFYERVYVSKFHGVLSKNTHIDGIARNAFLFANKWCPVEPDVQFNNDKEIEALVGALCKHTVDFCLNEE